MVAQGLLMTLGTLDGYMRGVNCFILLSVSLY